VVVGPGRNLPIELMLILVIVIIVHFMENIFDEKERNY
jgi:hypothetical protein